eukprot:TRINITY_DN405_c0_g3_i4.p1 TRINITY_DN405_c0_g3~~TRINITY_DN405_c0_g3_i4.p1  ORF type:complete len:443 (-),score=78.63 TRINITY_DN405_c0_g3_i4:1740-3068(-)
MDQEESNFQTEDLGDTTELVIVLSQVFVHLARNGDENRTPRPATIFHSAKNPTMPVKRYLQRIAKYAPGSKSCYILSLIYLDRLSKIDPGFIICSNNIHRLLITSIMIATKFYDDQYFNNRYYAQVGGLPVAELNRLETDFLFRMQFSLHVDTECFGKYHQDIRQRMFAHQERQRRIQDAWSHTESPPRSVSPEYPPMSLPFEVQVSNMIYKQENRPNYAPPSPPPPPPPPTLQSHITPGSPQTRVNTQFDIWGRNHQPADEWSSSLRYEAHHNMFHHRQATSHAITTSDPHTPVQSRQGPSQPSTLPVLLNDNIWTFTPQISDVKQTLWSVEPKWPSQTFMTSKTLYSSFQDPQTHQSTLPANQLGQQPNHAQSHSRYDVEIKPLFDSMSTWGALMKTFNQQEQALKPNWGSNLGSSDTSAQMATFQAHSSEWSQSVGLVS